MQKPTTVDDYINQAPRELKERLTSLRSAIRKTAPTALEKISYGMPYYGYHGRLVYFAYFKHHIGMYIPPPITEQFQKELTGYVTAKATIQFPHDKKLPLPLIKNMVKARMLWNNKSQK